MLKSIELRARRDAVIHHQQVQLFLTVLVVDGGNQHAAGINAHHRARRQIGDGDAGLADQLFRRIVVVNTAQNHAIRAGSVVEHEFQELLALLHSFAGLDLHHAEIALGEGVKIHVIREQRLDLHLAEINRGLFDFLRRVLFLGLGLGLILGRRRGGSVQRLHRRDFKLTLFANQFFLIYLYFQSTFVSRPYYTFTPIRMSFVSSGVSIGVKWRM